MLAPELAPDVNLPGMSRTLEQGMQGALMDQQVVSVPLEAKAYRCPTVLIIPRVATPQLLTFNVFPVFPVFPVFSPWPRPALSVWSF